MYDQRFRVAERLRRSSEYQQVFQQGRKFVAPLFILHILPTSASHSRLGLAVSKRVGGAVVRNRIKRRLREIFRQHKGWFKCPCDVVVVARREAANASFDLYTQQFLMLLRRYPWAEAPVLPEEVETVR